MKNIIILLTFLWAITSYAVAPYGIKGQQQAATLYSNVHQFPNNQVTNLGGINALVETGNTNILANPSFEHSTFSTSWTNSAGTFTQETSVVIDGKASAKLVLSAQTMSLIQSSTLYAAQFADGVQGLAMVRIKSDIALKVCSIQAGTVSATNCVTTATDSKWGLYKIPFVMGATSNGISIASTGSASGTVYADEAFVGAINLESQNGACITSDCTTTFSAFVSSAGVVSGENVDFINGNAVITSTDVFTLTFNTGVFTVAPNFGYKMFNEYGTGTITIINSSATITASTAAIDFVSVSGTGATNIALTSGFWVTFTKTGADFTQAEAKKTGNVFTTQCGANCVDTFSAAISSTGVVSNENLEWIQSTSSGGTGIRNITFSTGTFSVAPNCVTTVNDSSRTTNISSVTNSSIQVRTFLTAVLEDRGFNIVCQKQGADFTATRTIQGTFNEVVTSPGISKPKVCHYAFGGAAATLAAPTLCTTGTCVNMKDTCGGMSTAFSSLGIYSLTVPSGTFANDSYITTTSQHGVPGNLCGAAAYLANSSGGATINIRCAIFIGGSDGVATNAHSSFVLQGSAP